MEDLIKALNIFLKYGNPHKPTHCVSIIKLTINPEIDPTKVSEEDKKELSTLGFFVENDTFKSYRYGSC